MRSAPSQRLAVPPRCACSPPIPSSPWPLTRPCKRSPTNGLAGDQIGLVVLGSVGDVEGVVSERDVVRAVAEALDPVATPAREVASTRLVWCDASASVREVAERMMEEYVRHVLLEVDGRLVGIVSARDLLGAYAISFD